MKNFETQWKKLANEKKLTPLHFYHRALLIALRSKTNVPKEDIITGLLQKHFSAITNKNKLANGMEAYSIIKSFRFWLMALKNVKNFNEVQKYGRVEILKLPLTEIFDTQEEFEDFKALAEMKIRTDKFNRKYIYYFTIQENLSAEQQGVQAGHVLFKLGNILSEQGVQLDPSEVYFQWIGIKDEEELQNIRKNHPKRKSVIFYEPDVNMTTSLAFYPTLWNKRKDFADYSLLTHSH